MAYRKFAVLIVALLTAACASQSGGGLLAMSSAKFENDKIALTVDFINSLRGCFPIGGTLQNKQSIATGVVYAQVFASNADGRTVGTWSVNFPPAIAGGSARAAAVTGDGGAGLQCHSLQFHVNG